jgi:hypothetical protein
MCTNHVERQPLGVLMRLVPKVSWRTLRIPAPNGSREVLFGSAGSRRPRRLTSAKCQLESRQAQHDATMSYYRVAVSICMLHICMLPR